jgi:hypothetical protein
MYRIFIEIRGAPAYLKKSTWNLMKKAAFKKVGEWWHKVCRPKHFTYEGAQEYGYTPRQGEQSGLGRRFWSTYTGRKLKKFGHKHPLEWSGVSKTRTLDPDIRSTSGRVQIVLHAPAFNFTQPRGRIRMWEEMTRISDKEETALAAVMNDAIGHELDNAYAYVREELYR